MLDDVFSFTFILCSFRFCLIFHVTTTMHTGNVFVIAAIILERNLQNVANYLVASLAVADLFVACLVMPLGAVYEVSTCLKLFLHLHTGNVLHQHLPLFKHDFVFTFSFNLHTREFQSIFNPMILERNIPAVCFLVSALVMLSFTQSLYLFNKLHQLSQSDIGTTFICHRTSLANI